MLNVFEIPNFVLMGINLLYFLGDDRFRLCSRITPIMGSPLMTSKSFVLLVASYRLMFRTKVRLLTLPQCFSMFSVGDS